jgi:hypothetical protein
MEKCQARDASQQRYMLMCRAHRTKPQNDAATDEASVREGRQGNDMLRVREVPIGP